MVPIEAKKETGSENAELNSRVNKLLQSCRSLEGLSFGMSILKCQSQ